jgi:Uma2 family endonuclease
MDPIWRLTVEQYHEMIRTDILTEDDPVELLEGFLVAKMVKKPPHSVATHLVADALGNIVPTEWHVGVQDPVTTGDSEPEPDVTVARGHSRQYRDHHPGPQDLAMLVEVADASLGLDRGSKKRVYAEARIPVYWIVNLIDRQIEVYTDPSGPADKPDFRQRHDYGPDDEVPVIIDGKEVGRIAVRDVLP